MLSDEQWAAIEHLFPTNDARQGRRPVDRRHIVDAILWVLSKGERWHNMPQQYPAAQTCYNRWLEWRRSGIWQAIVDTLGADACPVCPSPPLSQSSET